MKILFNCNVPFALTHGGQQIQLERTQAALQSLGLEVEPVRWWDNKQMGDIIHYAGRMPAAQIELAHQKGIKVVMAELLTAPGSRSRMQLRLQKIMNRTLASIAPEHFVAAFNWKSYRLADACVALTPWEAQLMNYLFAAPKDRIHVVPNGVEEIFLNSSKAARGQWLVCTATITERKRVLELAEAAVQAQTPLWIIGNAYSESDSYAQAFFQLARQEPRWIRYQGALDNRAKLAQVYREARGFVLLSAMESLSLSALEAAACECPLLLSDLPWARTVFGDVARYCSLNQSVEGTARGLRAFYDATPTLPVPPKPPSWAEIGLQIKTVYELVLSTSR